MTNVFFTTSPEHIKHNRMALVPDDDTLPLDTLQNSFVLYQDDDKAIVQYIADKLTIQELAEQTGCADPLSQEAVAILGITGSYLGRSLVDVFVRYPELEGVRTVETEDGEVEVDIVRRING